MNPWASTYPTVKLGHWPYHSWVRFTMTVEEAEKVLVSKGYSFKMVDGPHGPVWTCFPPEKRDFLIPNTMTVPNTMTSDQPTEVNEPAGEKNPSQEESPEEMVSAPLPQQPEQESSKRKVPDSGVEEQTAQVVRRIEKRMKNSEVIDLTAEESS